MLKVIIQEEMLVKSACKEPDGNWEEDFDVLVQPVLQDSEACYVPHRLDEKDRQGHYKWIFLSFTPDTAPVRDKMLYSATKATMKKSFGGGAIKDEVYGNMKSDLTLKGYLKHLEAADGPPPLSMAELELQQVHEAEKQAMAGTTSRHSHMHGLNFPITDDAIRALTQMKDGKLNYIQLSIDQAEETVVLQRTEAGLPTDQLKSCVPESSARYHLFLFEHQHNGDYLESVVFIYSCPGYKCPVKERMLYSSCKNPVVDQVKQRAGLEVAKTMEVDEADEISEQVIYDEVHPQKTIVKTKFAKPKPPGRGRSPYRE